jgi:hypothetical protein
VSYNSSPLEQKWVRNALVWGSEPCKHVAEDKALFEQWVPQVTAYEQAPADKLPTMNTLAFSLFMYRDACSGAVASVPIEPFAGTGRHPGTCAGKDVLSKDYLLIERRLPARRKAFFFDMGASVWKSGDGGPSQSWFHSVYKQRGVRFDGIYAWEVQHHDPKEVFKQIPGEVRAAYHWFNIPADPTPGAADNPFSILLQVAQRDDLVVCKIDIDNSPVELQFINQILTNRNISSLIDELFFEHHYNMHPMVDFGWSTSGSASGMTMVDSANIFIGLRNLGIRAHVWV